MTTAATLEPQDTPLSTALLCMQLFIMQFPQLFEKPRPQQVKRAHYTKACAFLRAVEAVVRRMLMMFAIALLPELPPVKPPRPAKARAKTKAPGREAAARDACSFNVLPPVIAKKAPRAAARTATRNVLAELVDTAPVARRYNALVLVLKAPEAAARRLAVRVRALRARGVALYYNHGPRLHPEHEKLLSPLLVLLSEDANDALRILQRTDTS